MKKIKYHFLILLNLALMTHQSYANEHRVYKVYDTCAEALGFKKDLDVFYAQRDVFWRIPSHDNFNELVSIYNYLYKESSTISNTALHVAAQLADLSEIDRLVSQGVSVDIRGQRGVTPLMAAVTHGHINAINLLLELGADVNAPDVVGLSSLSYAAANNSISAAYRLLEKGAEINQRNLLGEIPIMFAVRSGNLDMFRALASMGASLTHRDVRGFTILHIAVFYPEVANQAAMVEEILDRTAHLPTDLKFIDWPDPVYQFTPLHWAAYTGHVDAITVLLKRGASLTVANGNGELPIHVAARNDQVEAFLKLRDAGPNLLEIVDNELQTPVDTAEKHDSEKILSALGLLEEEDVEEDEDGKDEDM